MHATCRRLGFMSTHVWWRVCGGCIFGRGFSQAARGQVLREHNRLFARHGSAGVFQSVARCTCGHPAFLLREAVAQLNGSPFIKITGASGERMLRRVARVGLPPLTVG